MVVTTRFHVRRLFLQLQWPAPAFAWQITLQVQAYLVLSVLFQCLSIPQALTQGFRLCVVCYAYGIFVTKEGACLRPQFCVSEYDHAGRIIVTASQSDCKQNGSNLS